MVGRTIVRVLPVLAFLGLSCASGPKPAKPDMKAEAIPLLIWIDPGAGISEADTLKACEEWKPKGIRCFLVDRKRRSDIRIFVDEGDCKKNDKGTYTLATAWRGGKIVFNMKCFGSLGKPNRHKFRAVMVHEIGHHLGIWNHVPLSCKDPELRKHATGVPVCGPAVMNPMYDKDVHFVTAVDSLAFDIRDRNIAVAVDLPGTDRAPDCTYTAR